MSHADDASDSSFLDDVPINQVKIHAMNKNNRVSHADEFNNSSSDDNVPLSFINIGVVDDNVWSQIDDKFSSLIMNCCGSAIIQFMESLRQ